MRVNLNVLLFDELFDVLEGVTAAIVLAVRDEKQRFLRIGAFLEFLQAEIDRVVHCRHALRRSHDELALELRHVRCEIRGDFRPVRKLDQKILVFGIAGLQKGSGGIAGRGDLVLHAAADIEYDADADRNVFGGEVLDLLFDFVFPDLEVVGLSSPLT